MANGEMVVAALLEQINGGQAAEALPELERLLALQPEDLGLLTLKAEALRLCGRTHEAIAAYRHAAQRGAGSRNWLVAGTLLAGERDTDAALACLERARAEAPDDDNVLDALITTTFNANRFKDGVEAAYRQLEVSVNPSYLSRAALFLQNVGKFDDAARAFRKVLDLAPDDAAIVGSSLVATRYTCQWDTIEPLQQKMLAWYAQGNFASTQEYPLTNLTWCADEAINLAVTEAYVARTVPTIDEPPLCSARTSRAPGERLRVGYLSSDFRNHATMHLMAGLLEAHDRARFEIFAYDYTAPDVSDYRQRFLDSVEHHVEIHTLTDRQAAARIAEDDLDILFDLKLYTGGGRSGVMAYRPARLQAAYIGFPGSAGSPHIDYIVSDRFVTPDSSAPYYPEKFCRLPHSYQCNDRKRLTPPSPGPRAAYGLPEDKIVFGAFNQSYKIDRGSFELWMRVLAAVPDAVLWLLGQSTAQMANLAQHAERMGVDPARVIFAPFADPHDHLTRLQVVDAVLDTLICNGHTTTSDALWAGVPVITARGQHFSSRVSESLLNALGVPELVGQDRDDMVRIARHIATDATYRAALRAKVEGNRLTEPLFDTLRFTRNFERGIEAMVQKQREGGALDHLDVTDCGPVCASEAAVEPAKSTALRTLYGACPLCQSVSTTLGAIDCRPLRVWRAPLPTEFTWMQCTSPACRHVHARYHWTDAGRALLGAGAAADQPGGEVIDPAKWVPVVDKVVALLGGYGAAITRRDGPVYWVDVGCGAGGLVMTAADYGYTAVGLDTNADTVNRMRQYGLMAMQHDFTNLQIEIVVDVLTMMDVLPQMTDPRAALRKAYDVLRPGGVLVVSAPQFNSAVWKLLESGKANPFWQEIANSHLFSRETLVRVLGECGFEVADFRKSPSQPALMELYAIKPCAA
ncbi:methyltransferase domain-containing protein [Paraburkholderia sp. J67]|uniref:O-linked N-acetylglucosamine transferase family protein n=1 Tax=Paraburkholderia sp. J67 TaxID=2805435 RepID=UPI002ABDCD7E|nr:methyltransferase domain-containing protein [Paraburkholderia sp. J67]